MALYYRNIQRSGGRGAGGGGLVGSNIGLEDVFGRRLD